MGWCSTDQLLSSAANQPVVALSCCPHVALITSGVELADQQELQLVSEYEHPREGEVAHCVFVVSLKLVHCMNVSQA